MIEQNEKTYKAAIFDLDGTLLNTISDLGNSGNYTLKKLGYPTHEIDEYKYFVGNGIPKLIERMLPKSLDPILQAQTYKQALDIFMNHYSLHSEDMTAPYDGISQLLDELKVSGIKLGVLTNKADGIAKIIIQKYFGDRFDCIQGLTDGTKPKPDPENALKMAKNLSAAPNEILYIGDSGVDMQTAKNAGFFSCGVLWGFRTIEELLDNGASAIAEKPMDIIKLLSTAKDTV